MGTFYHCESKASGWNDEWKAKLTPTFSYRGDVIATCEEKETIVYADIGKWWKGREDDHIQTIYLLDPAEIETIRSNFPLYNQRRFDIYADVADSVVVDENGNGTKKQ